MDAERAETYLRHMAETELRRELTRPYDRSADPRMLPTARVNRAASALRQVGAPDEQTLRSILIEFDEALVERTIADRRVIDQRLKLSVIARTQWMRLGPADAGAGPRPAIRVVPIGRIVTMADDADDADGVVAFSALKLTARTAQLIVFLKEPVPRPIHQHKLRLRDLHGVDDTGRSYRLNFDGLAIPREMFGYLDVSPLPPSGVRWLELLPGPGEPAVRLDLTSPPTKADVAAGHVQTSPGELLLDIMAADMLATEGMKGETPSAFTPHEVYLAPDLVHQWTIGLGEVVTALEAAGALPAGSPVPGRLATLCEQLDARQHGIAAEPRTDLPDRWASVLAQCRQRAARRPEPGRGPAPGSGPGAVSPLAVVLPDVDGARYTLAGLRRDDGHTLLTIHASGVKIDTSVLLPFGPGRYPAASWWLRDDAGRWHVTTNAGGIGEGRDHLMRLRVVPTLDAAVTSLDLVITGRSDRLRVHLPVSWHPAG
jgi:hypothetical protein